MRLCKKEKITKVVLQPHQGIIYVLECHGRFFSYFTVDTFRSNYNFTERTLEKILDIFQENLPRGKNRRYFSANQTFVCSPRVRSFMYQKMFDETMVLIRDRASYVFVSVDRVPVRLTEIKC
jgi:hypothetical protein